MWNFFIILIDFIQFQKQKSLLQALFSIHVISPSQINGCGPSLILLQGMTSSKLKIQWRLEATVALFIDGNPQPNSTFK